MSYFRNNDKIFSGLQKLNSDFLFCFSDCKNKV